MFLFRFLKGEIDDILSHENILEYMMNLRTKVLWPDDTSTTKPMKNVKHRAYNAIINKLPGRKIEFDFYFIFADFKSGFDI
jgi:hypothetical protein